MTVLKVIALPGQTVVVDMIVVAGIRLPIETGETPMVQETVKFHLRANHLAHLQAYAIIVEDTIKR